jgi:hypothetical protein
MKRAVSMVTLVCFLSLGAFAYDAQKGSWKGWVSDEKCGAAGASAAKADCTKKCIEGGQKIVFVKDKDKSVLAVANPEALKGHEGHHIKVKGTVENGALTVQSATMLK